MRSRRISRRNTTWGADAGEPEAFLDARGAEAVKFMSVHQSQGGWSSPWSPSPTWRGAATAVPRRG